MHPTPSTSSWRARPGGSTTNRSCAGWRTRTARRWSGRSRCVIAGYSARTHRPPAPLRTPCSSSCPQRPLVCRASPGWSAPAACASFQPAGGSRACVRWPGLIQWRVNAITDHAAVGPHRWHDGKLSRVPSCGVAEPLPEAQPREVRHSGCQPPCSGHGQCPASRSTTGASASISSSPTRMYDRPSVSRRLRRVAHISSVVPVSAQAAPD
jgi:hypothetical protein